eukprot:jgi/Chlat1/546/Chrsp103S01118
MLVSALAPSWASAASAAVAKPLSLSLTARATVAAASGDSRVRRRRWRSLRSPTQTRLAALLVSAPNSIEQYFADPRRMVMFGGIAIFGGFYVANTISLSFGAISVNDVVAAAFCTAAVETTTSWFYKQDRRSRVSTLINLFKIGFTIGLITDAFKII